MEVDKHPKLEGDRSRVFVSEDEFGLSAAAAAVATALTNQITANGYIVGIEGPWGSGKSTFVDFVQEKIGEQSPDHIIVNFEPWLISQRDTLLFYFFGQLATEVDNIKQVHTKPWQAYYWVWKSKKARKRLAKKIRRFGLYAGALASPFGFSANADPTGTAAAIALGLKSTEAVLKLISEPSADLESLKNEIVDDLKKIEGIKSNIRFTVFIDDLDRLEPSEVIEILRLVRKVADFPFITYVLNFDHAILCKYVEIALKLDAGGGNAYLEKFFQSIVSIPPQEPFALRRFGKNLLNKSFPKEMSQHSPVDMENSNRREALFDTWAGKLLETPRDAIRWVDTVKLGWPHIAGKADFIDFAWLQLVKLKAGELHHWIREYVRNIGAKRDGGHISNDAAEHEAERLNKIMSDMGWDQKQLFVNLEYFLPGIEMPIGGNEKYTVFSFQDNELATFEQGKRLGSPSHWRLYFAFDLPSYAVDDTQIATFLKAAREDTAQAVIILKDLVDTKHDNPVHFIDIMLGRLSDQPVGTFTPEEANGLSLVFAAVMDEIIPHVEQNSDGPVEIWRQAYRLLRKAKPANYKQLFSDGKSVNWLASMLRDEASIHGKPEGRRVYAERQWLNEKELEQATLIMIARFRKIGIEKIVDMSSPLDVLFCWVQLGDKTDVQKAIDLAIQDDEVFLKVLNVMRNRSISSDKGVSYPFRKDYLVSFMDADVAKQKLERLSKADDVESYLQKKAAQLLQEWENYQPF